MSGNKEWVQVQKKTFTNWTNDKLKDTDRRVEELETDLVDGVTLIKLLQVLSHGKKIGRYGRFVIHVASFSLSPAIMGQLQCIFV